MFWWKTGRHFAFGLQIDKIFGVEEAGRIGAVVGPADLADDLRDLGKRGQNDARLVHGGHALGRAGAGSQRAAHPDRAFIQVRQELRADDAAEAQKARQQQRAHRHADGNVAMFDGPGRRMAVAIGEPAHHRVVPFARALGEEEARQHRREQHGEDQRAQQGERHRPGHGLEQTALDRLQRKDRQVRGDDDADGVEDRALHLVRGLTNLLDAGCCYRRAGGRGDGRCSRP